MTVKGISLIGSSGNITLGTSPAGGGNGNTATLLLTGTSINGIANTILSNSSSTASTLTIQNDVLGETKAMNLKLGATTNVIQASSANTVVISSAITEQSANSGVTFTGGGTLNLSGTNAFTGVLTIQSGILKVATINNASTAGALGNSANAVVLGSSGASGTVEYTDGTASSNKPFTLAASGTGVIQVDTATTSLTLSGKMDGSGAFKKNGPGALTLSGNNIYTGATTVMSGTLKAGVASVAGVSGAFGNNSAVTLTNASGVVLDITGFNTQVGSLTGGGTSGGNVTLGSATLTVGGDNTSPAAFGGVISGVNGGLTKIGTGNLTVTGANTYSGPTTVTSGTITAGANSTLSSSSAFTVGGASSAGVLDLKSFHQTVSSLAFGAGTGTLRFDLGTDATARLTTTGNVNLANGSIAFNGSAPDGTVGKYILVKAGGTFSGSSVGGSAPTNYRFNVSGSVKEVDLIHLATIAIDATPTATTIIKGGSIGINGHVANIAPINSDDLSYSLSSSGNAVSGLGSGTRVAGDANAAAGANFSGSFTSTTLGNNSVTVTGSSTGINGSTNSSASANMSINVLDHSNAAFSVTSGNNQRVIVGSSASATFSLSNSGSARAALDVDTLSAGLSGTSGSAVVASGGSANYVATLDTSNAALAKAESFSLKAGDQQNLAGASALSTKTANVTVDVLNHAVASFEKTAALTSKAFDFGTYFSDTGNKSFSLGNIFNFGDALTAKLDFSSLSGITRVASGTQLITLTGESFTNLLADNTSAALGGGNFLASFDTDGLAAGTYTEQFTLKFSDEAGILGGSTTSLVAALEFKIVPEPGTGAMLVAGLGMLAFGQKLRRCYMHSR